MNESMTNNQSTNYQSEKCFEVEVQCARGVANKAIGLSPKWG